MKEVHFKTINDIYLCKEFLKRYTFEDSFIHSIVYTIFKIEGRYWDGTDGCKFCQIEFKTQNQMFYDCTSIKLLWDD